MTKPDFRITFHKRRSRDFMDPHPDYAVCVNGQQMSELNYNISGYVGRIPTIRGGWAEIQEGHIGAWNALKHRLNDEAARAISGSSGDQDKVVYAHHTWDGRVMRVFNGRDERFVLRDELMMAERVFGQGAVPWGFCRDAAFEPPLREASPEAVAELLIRSTPAGDDLAPFLLGVARGDRPRLTGRTRKALMTFSETEEGDDVVVGAKSWFFVWAQDAYPETIGEMTERFLNEVERRNVWVDDLPGAVAGRRRTLALRLDDAVAILRGAMGRGRWDAPAEGGSFPERARPLLAQVFRSCDEMGADSPLARADQGLVSAMRGVLGPSGPANGIN